MTEQSKPVKVIIFDTFTPKKSAKHSKPDEDIFFVASWGGRWAIWMKKRYPDLDIEVWRPEPEFTKVTSRKAFGVDCTIFPAKGMIISRRITIKMLQRLYRYRRKYNLVIHPQNIFDWRFNAIMPILLPNSKFVLSHHGGVFPNNGRLSGAIKRKVLQLSYRKIDAVTYLREAVRQEVKKANSKVNTHFLPVGANFDHFKPLDKAECRRELNLPLNKVLAVYVGAFYKLKGVDHILNVYSKLKGKNLEILLVGGNEKHELYNEVVKSGCRHWGYVNHDFLRIILSAADFYIHPTFSKDFGGIDVSWMEALACNRPVLTPMLKELDFDYSKLGILLDNEKNMVQKTEGMMQSYHKFTNCREAAIEQLDGNTAIIDKLYEIYITQYQLIDNTLDNV
jgi:glycosyltransferase involved in cell wall biosynthesis